MPEEAPWELYMGSTRVVKPKMGNTAMVAKVMLLDFFSIAKHPKNDN